MKTLPKFLALFLVLSVLCGCVDNSQNSYTTKDVGKETFVEFGKIIRVRDVKIQGETTGTGAIAGGAAGGIGGANIGQGNGQVAGTLVGVVIGAVVGGIAEHELQSRKGIEYTITKRDGRTVTIVQNIASDDVPLKRGDHVMIQTNGGYMRVLPADDLPAEVKRPAEVKVVD